MLKLKELEVHPILNSIDLQFAPRKIYGILGPNGSGKTTLFKAIKKIIKPSQGSVIWNESNLHEASRAEISKAIAMVPQCPDVSFGFTVKEFIELGAYPANTICHQFYLEVLSALDLTQHQDKPLPNLSGGERQRTYIARSLLTKAPVLLLDEPMANLDICHKQEIWEILKSLATAGKIVILSLHDLQAAKKHCDEIIVLSKGTCVAKGNFTNALTEPVLKKVFGVTQYE